MKKRILALTLALLMVLSMLPMAAFAAAEETDEQIDGYGDVLYYDAAGKEDGVGDLDFVVSTSKTIAALENENEFEITLQVETTVDTEKLSVAPDAAVVLVIDISGSMNEKLPDTTTTRLDAAKDAAVAFLDSFVKDAANAVRMVSIVTFNGNGTGTTTNPYKGYSEVAMGWTDVTDEAKLVAAKDKINGLTASLGTFTQGGLILARNLYLPDNAPEDAAGNVIENRFVLMLTDGNPTHMRGTRTGSGSNIVYTSDISYDGLNPLEGNLLNGVEEENTSSSVSAARGAAAEVAAQIKNGWFKDGQTAENYTAKIYTIGFGLSGTKYANTYGGSGTYTGDQWLSGQIASTENMHYTVDSTVKLNYAFEKIAETITRMANAWRVIDPMAEYIVFDGIILNDKNSAEFDGGTLTWSIKDSEPTSTCEQQRDDVTTMIYTYELVYKVSLNNLTDYIAQDIIGTNGETTLTYVIDVKKADEYGDEDFIEVQFTIPEIHGYAADLTFTKVGKSDVPLAGAKFVLYYDGEVYDTAASGDDGVVSFEDIPSGHSYTLVETEAPEGYELPIDEYAVVVSYGKLTSAIAGVQISNKPIKEKGTIALEKTVDGIDVEIWIEGRDYGIADLIERFQLYKVSGDGAPINNDGAKFIKSATVNAGGSIVFDELDDGWYAIEEVLTLAGKKVFEQAPIMYILIANGITFTGTTTDFDEDAFYTIVNGYGSGYTLGYSGLNNSGDIFPIAVTNTKTGVVYPSFCANAGSTNFAGEGGVGCSGYMVAERVDRPTATYADFLLAYNYIANKYGKLEDNRALTQVVTWTLLGAIDINSVAFSNIDDWKVDKAAVEGVIANYKSFSGEGKVIDVVFMVCDKHSEGHDFSKCQPQLVPLYGNPDKTFNNKTKKVEDPKGSLEVVANVKAKDGEWVYGTKTIGDTLVTYVGNPGNIDKKADGGYVNEDYIDNSQGGFTAVAIQTDGTVRKFEISKSGHGNPKFQEEKDKVGLTYTAQVIGDEVVVIFDNLVAGSIAFGLYSDVADIKWAPGQYNYSKGHMSVAGSQEIRIPLSLAASGGSSSNIAPSITTSKNGNNVTINVGTVSWVVQYEKNATKVYEHEGYKVQIVYNGSGVNKTSVLEWPAPEPSQPEIPEVVYLAVHCGGVTFYAGTPTWKEWEVDYNGTLRLLVTDSDGITVYDKKIENAEAVLIENLKTGEYTCVLTGDGFATQTKSVTVAADGKAEVKFDGITVDYGAAKK